MSKRAGRKFANKAGVKPIQPVESNTEDEGTALIDLLDEDDFDFGEDGED